MKNKYYPPLVESMLLQSSGFICASANNVGIGNVNEQDLSGVTWTIS